MGGLARRATAIEDERESKDHVLVVDAGNSILGGWERDYEPKARLMVGAMNRMGYDALNVGEGELRLGPELLQEVMAQATFPLLSANITIGDGGPLLAQPSLLLDVDGRPVAIIGVTGPEATDLPQLEEGEVVATDPVAAVREQVDAASSQADIIIVLSYLGLEADQDLANQVEGIDLIVGAVSREKMAQPIRDGVHGTLITQAGDRGEWLGIVDLRFDRQGRVVSYEGRGHDLDESIPEQSDLAGWLQSVRPTPTPTALPSE